MTSEAMLNMLRQMEFTEELTRRQLEILASLGHFMTFSDGETIFREGSKGEFVYLILDGNVAIETHVPGHGRVTILPLGPGQLLGCSLLFPPQHKTAGGRALSQTRAIAINVHKLWDACQVDHDLGCAAISYVAQIIAERLRVTRLQLLDIFAPVTSQ